MTHIEDNNNIYFSITEVANVLEVSAATIRNWEKQGLFVAKRSSNSYRIYSLKDIEALKQINYYSKNYKMNAQAIKDIMMPRMSSPPIMQDAEINTPTASPSRKLLGKKWRDYRIETNKTLEEVANDVGISVSYLSKIENGHANVSYEILDKLAIYYDKSILHFFEPEEEAKVVVEKGKGEKIQTGLAGVMMESLIAQKERVLFPMMFYIEPDSGSSHTHKHNGEEFIHVLSGTVRITLDEKENHKLKEGDSIYFKSSTKHSWKNIGTKTAKLLWVHSPYERNIQEDKSTE
ncbi:cupin domain-containing protein [Gudongella sp. DL1XJH-153]|uniref:cupin domain-containing protein n=1 Tax=Gudongella sp. DL1XJH-153 TaxID=3409804 RepID=UPI003BB6E671